MVMLQLNSFVSVSRVKTPRPVAGVTTGATSCAPSMFAVKFSIAALADTEVMQRQAAASVFLKMFMISISLLTINEVKFGLSTVE